jgi:alpha-glucosidase
VADEFGPDKYLVGEIHDFDPVAWTRWFGDRAGEGLNHPFNFSLLKTAWDAAAVRANVDAYESALALKAGAWGNWVMGNHDEHRIATRLGVGQARVATMMLLTLRGTPTLYYGDELGMTDVDVPAAKEQDPWGKRVPGLGLGRDPERSPMLWTSATNAGFCPDDVEPWLPIGEQADTHSVDAQRGNDRAWLSIVKHLLDIRHGSPALQRGEYRSLDAPDGVFAFERTFDGDRVVVLLNFTGEAKVVRMSIDKVVASTSGDIREIEPGHLILAADEGVICR